MGERYGIRLIAALALAAALIGGAVGGVGPVRAAPPAQQALSFEDEQPTAGTLGGGATTTSYGFTCEQDGIGSVIVETTSGDLAVEVTVVGVVGEVVASGKLVQRDPNVTIAEAFAMPAAGACTVMLSASGATSGDYTVRLLRGYAQLDAWDHFTGTDDPLSLAWEPYASNNMTVTERNQQLRIEVIADNLFAYAVPTVDQTWSDLYMQADFTVDGAPSYAEYGFALRINADSTAFYTATFSSDGDYSIYYLDENDNWTAVQDWTVSSVVDGTATNARGAVWVHGNTFRLYWGNQFVTEVTDTNNFAADGSFGVAAATTVDQTDGLTVYADNLVVTSPYPAQTGLPFSGVDASQITPTTQGQGLMGLFGATQTPSAPVATPTEPAVIFPTSTPASGSEATPTKPAVIFPTATPPSQNNSAFPQSLSSWQSNTPGDVVSELRKLDLVPAGGSQSINVPSSYGDTSSSGFSFYPLGQGRSFLNFVLGFDARLVYSGAGAGCGMYFRETDSASHSAMVFEDGWALLGQWDLQGNLTDASILEETPLVTAGQNTTNRVLVVAVGDMVLMYVNGQLFGSGSFTAQTGGIALEVYVPSDDNGTTVETYCQLNNIWMWEF